jgi:cell division septum initiation protein DivIVA
MAPDQHLANENAQLRQRIAQLEAEVVALQRDTAAAVASAQETLYWFERWGLDFNRVMSRREAEVARRSFRGARLVYRNLLTGYRWARRHGERLLRG